MFNFRCIFLIFKSLEQKTDENTWLFKKFFLSILIIVCLSRLATGSVDSK